MKSLFNVAACLICLIGSARAAETEDELYAAAKREGLVNWYSVILGNEAALPLARAFEARYPGIKVDHQRGNTVANAKRIIDESATGSVKGDVFDGSTTVVALLKAGLVESWTPPNASAIPQAYRDQQGRWTAVLMEFLTVGYDVDAVAPADIPKTREDLLDPKWRNKMIWSDTPGLTGGAGFVANTLMELGEVAGRDYLKKLKGQNIFPFPGDGHAVIGEIEKKKFALGLQIFNHHTFIERSLGHNIQWIKIEPILAFSNNMGLVRGAPHPNAAKLFINFCLSREGQTIIRDGHHIPSSSEVDALEPTLKTGFRVNYVDPLTAAGQMEGWQSVYTQIFK